MEREGGVAAMKEAENGAVLRGTESEDSAKRDLSLLSAVESPSFAALMRD